MASLPTGQTAGHVEKYGNVASVTNDPGPDDISRDKDVALAIVGDHAQDIDPAVEARVVRKIDLFLIPAMIIGKLGFRYLCVPFGHYS